MHVSEKHISQEYIPKNSIIIQYLSAVANSTIQTLETENRNKTWADFSPGAPIAVKNALTQNIKNVIRITNRIMEIRLRTDKY